MCVCAIHHSWIKCWACNQQPELSPNELRAKVMDLWVLLEPYITPTNMYLGGGAQSMIDTHYLFTVG